MSSDSEKPWQWPRQTVRDGSDDRARKRPPGLRSEWDDDGPPSDGREGPGHIWGVVSDSVAAKALEVGEALLEVPLDLDQPALLDHEDHLPELESP